MITKMTAMKTDIKILMMTTKQIIIINNYYDNNQPVVIASVVDTAPYRCGARVGGTKTLKFFHFYKPIGALPGRDALPGTIGIMCVE